MVHGRTTVLKCEYESCGKIYKIQSSLNAHIRNKHTLIAPLDCEQSSRDQSPFQENIEKSKMGYCNELKRRKSSPYEATTNMPSLGVGLTNPQRKPEDHLVHLTFPGQEIALGRLRKAFYVKALQACKEERFDKTTSPTFEDIISVNGKPTLRLKSSEHVPFFTRILESISA